MPAVFRELGEEEGHTPGLVVTSACPGELGQILLYPSLCPGGFRGISAHSSRVPKVGRLVARVTDRTLASFFSSVKFNRALGTTGSKLFPQST